MADPDELMPTAEAITPRVLQTPRAAAVAGILFALLFGIIVVLLRKVVPSESSCRRSMADPGERPP